MTLLEEETASLGIKRQGSSPLDLPSTNVDNGGILTRLIANKQERITRGEQHESGVDAHLNFFQKDEVQVVRIERIKKFSEIHKHCVPFLFIENFRTSNNTDSYYVHRFRQAYCTGYKRWHLPFPSHRGYPAQSKR
jgi:hypothetical protein